ncbi:MAG TPA: MerR family transcriptional regulator [Acidimicrobiia bacterium]
MDDDLLTIGELAERTGVTTSALRYYEELDLLRPAARVSGRRRYAASAVDTVGGILFLGDVGFTLREINAISAARSRSPKAWHDLARRKLEELDARIAEATAARIAIEHALECPRDDIIDCPNFQDIVRRRSAGERLLAGQASSTTPKRST